MFLLLLTPSWLSSVIAVATGLIVVIIVVFMSQYQGSTYQKLVADNKEKQAQVNLTDDYANFDEISDNTFLDVAPLLALWGVIGVVVYLFAVNIVNSIKHAAEFEQELNYANTSRQELIKTAFLHLAIRVVVGVALILYILVFFHQLLPYSIGAALAASAVGLLSLNGILYLIIAAVSIMVGMHIYTVLLRLLLLKPRIFSKALYLN